MPALDGPGFAEAETYLRDKLKISDAEWRGLIDKIAAASADAAEAAAEAMRRDIVEALVEAIAKGETLAEFRGRFDQIAARYGWSGTAWYADLVFRMETANANAAGRWEQIQKVKLLRPYVRYLTVGDDRVRPTHRAWHGVVLPVDHPFWRTHWPPNGFNCRCTVQSLSARDLARYGFGVTPDSDPALAIPPDKGFGNNVGLDWDSLRSG